MTIITGIVAGNVRRMLANGGDTIVAGVTSANYLCVIDDGRWYPYRWAMAILTDISRLNVRRVFTSRLSAVMTADAVAKDVYVIKIRGCPGGRDVTVIAGITTGNMGRILAGRRNTVVATNTIANYAEVIENSREPAC